VWEMVDKTDQ